MKPEVTIEEIQEVMAPLGQSDACIESRALEEGWDCLVRGGNRSYISDLLPENIKKALKAATLPTVKEDKLPALGIRRDQKVYREQEEKAFAKAKLAEAYLAQARRAPHGQKKKAKRLFIENYNLGAAGLFPEVFKLVGKVDLKGKTVEGWIAKLKKNDWEPMCLADTRGFAKRGNRAITPEQMEIILTIVKSPYNTPGKPMREIIRQAMSIMENRGMTTLSDATYVRWLRDDWIPYHSDEWIWWREGDKGLNDKVAYWLQRDYNEIEPGDLLVADGHVLNFDIINPETGKPKRMLLILFYDAKSNFPLGWEIMPTENTEAISSALRRAILRLGRIPTAVYIDNGRAFKGKYFTGTNLESEFRGLYHSLGIKPIIAKPYHGQSKVVERFFGVFGELERLAPSYVGNSIENKPAHMNRGEKLRQKLHLAITKGAVPTIEDAHRAIAIWFDKYVNTPQGPNSHIANQSPNQVMVPGPGVDPVLLRCLMMKSETRMIRRRGINIFGKDSWYYSPELYGRKHKVFVRYDLVQKDSILVYDAKTGEFVCEAFKMAKVHPMAFITGTEEEQAEYQRQMEMKNASIKGTISSAREYVNSQLIPETRQRIEAAGFSIGGGDVSGKVKPLPEPDPVVDEEQIKRDLAELKCFREDEPEDVVDDYTPVCLTEKDHVFATLKDLSESDRFEKLLEIEVRGWLIPKEHKAWMAYFEQTQEYARHREYFEGYRVKMALAYGAEAINET